MSLNRYNPKRDSNERVIIEALKSQNVRVWQMSGSGLPDLLCGLGPVFFVVEVKTPTGRLTPGQESFFEDCRYSKLPAFVVRTVHDIPRIIDRIRPHAVGLNVELPDAS